MHKQRIYIDTSVIGGCFDEEFAEWSNKLFDEFIEGKKIAVISDIVIDELEEAPDAIKEKIRLIPIENIEQVIKYEDADLLASKYIEFKAISKKFYNDALHIAIATINNCDVLVSWNFKHIVNYQRILLYNSINLMFGYKQIEIRIPKEVLTYEEDF
jgi:predicted nucleic acid-binding protein